MGVERHLFGNRHLVTPVDLCPAGEPRNQAVDAVEGPQRDEIVLVVEAPAEDPPRTCRP